MLVFEEKGKLQYPDKNLQEQTGEPTNHQLTFSDTKSSQTKTKKTTINTLAPIVSFNSEKFWLDISTD